jgi:D-alanine-D-alanine ligase
MTAVSRVSDAAEFGRVAVLMGGASSERDISLKTGTAVLDALRRRGVNAFSCDPSTGDLHALLVDKADRVFIALHGRGGEDGTLQGALEWMHIPYTGSGVMASAIAMDKIRSKYIFQARGIPTPEFAVARNRNEALAAAEELGFPLILKPALEGSSVGMAKAFNMDDVSKAARLALGHGRVVLVERCVVGAELTVSILDGVALPSIRIETPRVFYDYKAKYHSDTTRYHCPGMADRFREDKLATLAMKAFNSLGCNGWGRVDFMVPDDDEPQVLEVNTVPGMTTTSLVPQAAKQAGIDFDELCWKILETSMAFTDQDQSETAHGT